MIHVKFFRNYKTMAINADVQGHAMVAGKREEALICAGATTLVYTLAQSLQILFEQGLLMEHPQVKICDGYANITAVPKKNAESEVLMAFWTVQSGFYVLEHNFPQKVDLIPLEFTQNGRG